MTSQAPEAELADVQHELDEVQAELERMICHRLKPRGEAHIMRRYALLLATEELLLLERRRGRA